MAEWKGAWSVAGVNGPFCLTNLLVTMKGGNGDRCPTLGISRIDGKASEELPNEPFFTEPS